MSVDRTGERKAADRRGRSPTAGRAEGVPPGTRSPRRRCQDARTRSTDTGGLSSGQQRSTARRLASTELLHLNQLAASSASRLPPEPRPSRSYPTPARATPQARHPVSSRPRPPAAGDAPFLTQPALLSHLHHPTPSSHPFLRFQFSTLLQPDPPTATSPSLPNHPRCTADHGHLHRECVWSAVRRGRQPLSGARWLWGAISGFRSQPQMALSRHSSKRVKGENSPPRPARAGRRGPRRGSG